MQHTGIIAKQTSYKKEQVPIYFEGGAASPIVELDLSLFASQGMTLGVYLSAYHFQFAAADVIPPILFLTSDQNIFTASNNIPSLPRNSIPLVLQITNTDSVGNVFATYKANPEEPNGGIYEQQRNAAFDLPRKLQFALSLHPLSPIVPVGSGAFPGGWSTNRLYIPTNDAVVSICITTLLKDVVSDPLNAKYSITKGYNSNI